jgi:hypothetical protein
MHPATKRQDSIFIGVVALVHLVFFMLACHYKRIYMGDSFEYIYEALNIKAHAFFYSGNPAMPIEPEYMTQRQPVYPLFLLGVYAFTVNNWIVLLLQNALSIFDIIYLRRVLLRLGYTAKYDWFLLLLIVAYPAQFINANTIAPDILLQTCCLLYFGSFVALYLQRQPRHALSMSLALVVGMLVKPVLYPFVWIHVVLLLVMAPAMKLKLQTIALAALLPLCAMLAYNSWNLARTGKFHFSSNQAFNAVYYYYPYLSARVGADSANHFLAQERKAIATIPAYKDRYDHANARGLELLKSNFMPYIAFHLRHTARIFIEPGKAEFDLFTGKLTYGRLYSKQQTGFWATWKNKRVAGLSGYVSDNPSLIVTLLVFLFNVVRLVGFILFLLARRLPLPVRLFTLVFVGYFAVVAGPIANTRYFLPVSLIMIGTAVLGFMSRSKKQALG